MAIDWQRFPQVLKARRADAGLSQRALATKLGIAWNTIARLETSNRRPSLDMLERLADVFGCSVCDLIPETKTRRTKTKGVR